MTRTGSAIVALFVALSATAGIVAAGVPTSTGPQGSASPLQVPAATNGSATVDVSVGAQLSTVIASNEGEVRTAVEHADFEFEFERGDRVEAVTERLDELRDRARDLRERYREATAAVEAGEITRDEYARRIATLHDRAERVRASVNRTHRRAGALSETERESAGFNRTRLQQVADGLDDLDGAGPAALLARFTARDRGEVEIRVDGAVRIEAEREDGERSRELRRPGDDSTNLTVALDAARRTAEETLSNQTGNWTLVEASVHEDEGEYRFEFDLGSATETGEAEIRVDGSSGEVVRVEEEIEPRDADEEREDDETETDEDATETEAPEDAGEPTLSVANGTAAPGATLTVSVHVDGEPAADVPIEVDSDLVGTTGADGTLAVALPGEDDVRIRAETEEGDDELRFEFDED